MTRFRRSAPGAGGHRTANRRRVDLLLLLLALVVAGPFVASLNSQGAARLALTAAIWDRHSVDVRPYALGSIDRAFEGSAERSDKAPGQPFLAVPAYAAYRWVGGEPASHARVDENLGLWWVTLWSAVMPFGLLLVLFRRVADTLAPGYGTEVALAIGFGTLLLEFSDQLFGHVLAALLVLATWALAREAAGRRDRLLLAGLLAGVAVAVEYPTAAVAAIVLAVVAWRHRSAALWFVLGAVPGGALLATYQWVAFGSPIQTGYAHKPGATPGDLRLHHPNLGMVARALFGDRGLLLVSPLCLVGLVIAVRLACRPGPHRADGFVTSATFAAFLGVVSTWSNPWGGASPGPRYLLPAFSLLVFPLATEWRRIRLIGIITAAVGGIVGAIVLVTSPYLSVGAHPAQRYWLRWLVHGPHSISLFTMALGPTGWVVHALLIALVVRLLWNADRGSRVEPELRVGALQSG